MIQQAATYISWFIGALLGVATITFILNFFLPSRRVGVTLREFRDALAKLKSQAHGKPIVALETISKIAKPNVVLAHLWSEYCETLHPQSEVNQLGREQIVRYRATTVAETFFAEEVLVDTPLKADFYKHLPGILTGLGIIGTFSGLIGGLLAFQSADLAKPDQVRIALAGLIGNVGHAFIVSAAAIVLAMLATVLEKSQVTGRYREVEEICQQIDGMFDAGAGEEYLARLVVASESSATQAAQMKDSLVTDLRQILAEMTTQQIRASEEHSRKVSDAIRSPEQREQLTSGISHAITESLRPSMDSIVSVAQRVGDNQGDAINTMLADVLSRFATQMEGMYGGQLQGISELLQRTMQSLDGTVGRFEQISGTISSAGKDASDKMAERLADAMGTMEARQRILNDQMAEFVAQIREMVSSSQSESAQKLEETLTKLGSQVTGLIGDLGHQVSRTAESQEETSKRFADHTTGAVSSLSGQVQGLVAQSVATQEALQVSVTKLTSVTSGSIERLNAGAEALAVVVDDIAKAGRELGGMLQAASSNTDKIVGASQSLATASTATRQSLDDYRKMSTLFASTVTELRAVIETAKREGSMTTELVGRLRAASEQLGKAESNAEQYLGRVSDVLVKAHADFADNIEQTLRKGNAQFHEELKLSVNLLAGTIHDLGDMLDGLNGKK